MTRTRIQAAWFEELYQRDADPWSFATSAYEHAKYARTMYALGPVSRRFRRAFEAGCSIGVFTELLASRCDELLAVDASPTAVGRARTRLAPLPHVRVEQRLLPEQLPAGQFDLVVCSELLYYWDECLLRESLPALEALVASAGSLLAVHWRPPTRTYPLCGDEVHEILAQSTRFVHAHTEQTANYLIDRFDHSE
jgi:SAM-dependent methyltransferase